MFFPNVGEGIPDVTVPMFSSPPSVPEEEEEKMGAPSRAGAPSTINPIRLRGGPTSFLSCSRTFEDPMKLLLPPRRSLPITQDRPASTGVMSSLRSCPYRHMPASRRRLSRAPRPVSWTGARKRSFVNSSVWFGGMEI